MKRVFICIVIVLLIIDGFILAKDYRKKHPKVDKVVTDTAYSDDSYRTEESLSSDFGQAGGDTEASGDDEEEDSNDINASRTRSIEKSQKELGYNFQYPTSLPEGYAFSETSIVEQQGGKFAEIDYSNGHNIMTFRASTETDDLGYRFVVYDKEKEVTIDDLTINCSCNGDTIHLAKWEREGCYYCFIADTGLELGELKAIIQSLR